MSAPRKYGDELRERATRMAVELRQDPATKPGAIKRVADQLGMHPETLRNWVRQAEIDGGVRPDTTTDDAKRLTELERENRGGASPVPASSGLTNRHRLSRAGHREANAALYRAVIVRMRLHQPTIDYVAVAPPKACRSETSSAA
jgi:transposase